MKRVVWAAGHPSGQEADISAPRRGTTPWHLVTETGNGDYMEMCRQQRRMCFLGKLGEMKMIPGINIKHSVSRWEASKKNESMKTQRTGSSMAIREGSASLPVKRKQFLPQCFMKRGMRQWFLKLIEDIIQSWVLQGSSWGQLILQSPFPLQLRVSTRFSEHAWWSQGLMTLFKLWNLVMLWGNWPDPFFFF